MDTKQIVEKALKGEDYAADVANLSDEEKVTFNIELGKAASEAAKAELDRVAALRKEGNRVEEKNKEKESATANKFREEQLSIAKDEFFKTYSLTDAEKATFEEEFKRIDSGSVTTSFILRDLRKAYVAMNPEAFLGAKAKADELEKNAADFMAGQAGGSNSMGGPDADKYSKEAKELYKDWQKAGFGHKTLAEAQAIIDKGSNWKKSSLSD